MRPIPQETADLVTYIKETFNGKLLFCAVLWSCFTCIVVLLKVVKIGAFKNLSTSKTEYFVKIVNILKP